LPPDLGVYQKWPYRSEYSAQKIPLRSITRVQRVRRALGAEHKDWRTRLAYCQCQPVEVAVPGDDAEHFAAATAQFGHDVDHKRDVCCDLPRRVAEYLDGADAKVAKESQGSCQSGAPRRAPHSTVCKTGQ
jgi:hypothetical protein